MSTIGRDLLVAIVSVAIVLGLYALWRGAQPQDYVVPASVDPAAMVCSL